jgi:HD-GYP domain-containing protein (c-di-GMP phosphodiesterase class II)
VIASLSLATDMGTGLPLEHGLESTLVATRLCDHLGVDAETASQAYYACLLFYVGCTADADVAADLFAGGIHANITPVMFGSRGEIARGLVRALTPPDAAPAVRVARVIRRLPDAVRVHPRHLTAVCEVGEMLTERLGLPPSVQGLFAGFTERWDGKGAPNGIQADAIPLAVRIVHVARDATFHCSLGGPELAAQVLRDRSGGAFDPAVAEPLADAAADLLAVNGDGSAWDDALRAEPGAQLVLRGDAIDSALAAIGDFTDLISPYLVGHSSGVARLASAAADRCGLPPREVSRIRRAALVHDVGRVAVPAGIWQKRAPLSADEWEQVRLHPYHCERALSRAPLLAELATVASAHHERLDGSGYHRGAAGAALSVPARILAAADAYHAMTEPRPHRDALDPDVAAKHLAAEASAGRLDADAVTQVLEAAGQRVPRIERPSGLTEREAAVLGLVARGLQTKQIAHALGISVKTADHHIENAYSKIGVSTRAAAALFAMEHGLAAWGELPIAARGARA